jgi:hypothetical protein
MTLGIKFSTHEFSGTLPSHGRMGMEGGNEVELEPTRWAGPGHALSLSLSLSFFFLLLFFTYLLLFFYIYSHVYTLFGPLLPGPPPPSSLGH